MRSRAILVLVVLAFALATAATAGRQKLTLTLDWTPNPDHIGLYYAQSTGLFAKAGLDVTIRAPSDPTAPLKLVAAGQSDLAVSYEQELFFAAERKLPVIAVAAVVPQPLNSIIAIEPNIHSVRDLKGRTIGITGVPSDYAALDTALASAGLTRKDVHIVSVGYNLLPALLAHKVDAVIGVYRNVEGVQLQERGLKPTIITLDRVGIPSYDELVLVANAERLRTDSGYRSVVRRAVGAFLAGTAEARLHPAHALAVLQGVTASDKRFLSRAVPATLALLSTPNGVGCMSSRSWQRFGAWMHARSLLRAPIPVAAVMTTRFLPARCTRSS
jgi:putative hydroxymethylpyrimidine transport system substrate-binding protein